MNTAISPRKVPRQARSQATVDAILDATAQVLVERGYAAASTNAVAERAGVSVGSLYQYFPNKDALIAALQDRHVRQMLDVIEQQLDRHAGASLETAVRGMIEAVVEGHRIEAELHRVFDAQSREPRDWPHAHDEVEQRVGRQLRQLLADHRDELVVSDVKLATFTLMHAVHALVHAAVLDRPSGMSLKALTGEITQMAMRYLTAR